MVLAVDQTHIRITDDRRDLVRKFRRHLATKTNKVSDLQMTFTCVYTPYNIVT